MESGNMWELIVVGPLHYTDTIVLMKKNIFLSFYDLGSCKSLEGDRWVVI